MDDEGSAQSTLDVLAGELASIREAGLEPLDVEKVLPRLPVLLSLGFVVRRTRTDTTLGRAQALCNVIREALDRVALSEPTTLAASTPAPAFTQALMLWRVHPSTQGHTIAEARLATQQVSRLADRQYRRRQEPRLLRLVAQAVLDVDRDDDLTRWGRALEVGADVPQTVAMYWLRLFADHYFRLESSAYAMQFDYMTAVNQLRDEKPSWKLYLATAVYWNVEFSYLRDRFFRLHGPMWFTPTDEGGERLTDSVERIEYHDPFPDEYMARLRRLYGSLLDSDHDTFTAALAGAGIEPEPIAKAEQWLRRCECPKPVGGVIEHGDRCEVGIVLKHCDICGETVEGEFVRIQGWYRNPRFSTTTELEDKILSYRTSS